MKIQFPKIENVAILRIFRTQNSDKTRAYEIKATYSSRGSRSIELSSFRFQTIQRFFTRIYQKIEHNRFSEVQILIIHYIQKDNFILQVNWKGLCNLSRTKILVCILVCILTFAAWNIYASVSKNSCGWQGSSSHTVVDKMTK